jgi:protein transport protein SEC20
MSLEVLAARTERVVSSPDEDEKTKRIVLGAFRRAIENARAQQEDDVDKHQRVLDDLENKFRADVSDQAMRQAANYASKRAALLTSRDSQHRKEVLGRADLLFQSRDANESLVRTRDLMVKELSRVNEVNAVLLADSEKLRDVGGEYTTYDSALKTSRGMLKTMQRRENTDRMLIGFGLLFFLLVVAYILKRRLLPFFSPIGWLIEKVASFALSQTTNATVEATSGTVDEL